jgi:hypothetical protein
MLCREKPALSISASSIQASIKLSTSSSQARVERVRTDWQCAATKKSSGDFGGVWRK